MVEQRSTRKAVVALLALAVSTFVYVTTEILPIGLLLLIAADLGIEPSAVGLLVTWYGLVVVAHTTRPATTTTAPTAPSTSHQRRRAAGPGVRPSRRSPAATPYPASVPSRYPTAADSPLTAPWAYGPRGSMLGSSDHHQKSSATAVPPKADRRSSQPRCGAPLLSTGQASGTRTTSTGTGEHPERT
jgi:hypothetical protein